MPRIEREVRVHYLGEMSRAHQVAAPPKAKPGDKIAVLSPSWAGPGVFPDVQEIALRVLEETFDLVPVEYPTTRQVGASSADRARDLMAAFADPSIRAVVASIGGSDQITLLPQLDPDVFLADPKPFFGYSDNTNVLNWLWNLGIGSYHGGSTLVHLARPGGPHRAHVDSLRRALFYSESAEIGPLESFTDLQGDWSDTSTLDHALATTAEPGWSWHNAERTVTGTSWGGNLEILHWNLAANRWILPVDEYAEAVLLLETSEEMPPADEVFRMLRNFGERGLLEQFSALVMAKPKSWHGHMPLSEPERAIYRRDQREAVERALADYNPNALAVFGPDFGHTDPQIVLPYGGRFTIDGPNRTITASY